MLLPIQSDFIKGLISWEIANHS